MSCVCQRIDGLHKALIIFRILGLAVQRLHNLVWMIGTVRCREIADRFLSKDSQRRDGRRGDIVRRIRLGEVCKRPKHFCRSGGEASHFRRFIYCADTDLSRQSHRVLRADHVGHDCFHQGVGRPIDNNPENGPSVAFIEAENILGSDLHVAEALKRRLTAEGKVPPEIYNGKWILIHVLDESVDHIEDIYG